MSSAPTHSERSERPWRAERRDRYYWRLLATGFCFLVFGLCALLLGTVLFPLQQLWPGSAHRHRLRVRATIQRAFRAFAVLMRTTRAMYCEFHGLERLGRPGQLIVANHPTLIDAILVLGHMPNLTSCVMKASLASHVLTRSAVRAAGYVPNVPTDAMIEAAVVALMAGESLVMFPEGTRTRPGEPPTFHRGAANIALRSARVLTPVFIECTPPTLTKADPWYRIPPRRFRMRVRVGEDVDLTPHRSSPLPRGSRTLNRELQSLFEREVPLELPG